MPAHGRRRELERARELTSGAGPFTEQVDGTSALRICEGRERAVEIA
jgi:hypothetical protein